MKDVELPRRVVVGENAIGKIASMVKDLALEGTPLIIADSNTVKIAGDAIRSDLGGVIHVLSDTGETDVDDEIEEITQEIKKDNIGFLAAVGGGRVIDITKVCAFKSDKSFLSIPTAASHDGIASPQASIKGRKTTSLKVHSPLGIIADTKIIRKAPPRLLTAGCADVISNYTAVLDWKLAADERGEYYGDYAASLSSMSAMIVMENPSKIKDNVNILVEALISNGVAMGIAGSSRPCSGSEHQFSHTLDKICPNPALHGEQCGVGTIMMAYLHKAEWEKVRDCLREIGAPTSSGELGIDKRYIIKALTNAHLVRSRYTILRNGLNKEEAVDLAKVTGVIE